MFLSKIVLSFSSFHPSAQTASFLKYFQKYYQKITTAFHTCWENFLDSTTNTETQARGTILLQSLNFLILLFLLTKLCLT